MEPRVAEVVGQDVAVGAADHLRQHRGLSDAALSRDQKHTLAPIALRPVVDRLAEPLPSHEVLAMSRNRVVEDLPKLQDHCCARIAAVGPNFGAQVMEAHLELFAHRGRVLPDLQVMHELPLHGRVQIVFGDLEQDAPNHPTHRVHHVQLRILLLQHAGASLGDLSDGLERGAELGLGHASVLLLVAAKAPQPLQPLHAAEQQGSFLAGVEKAVLGPQKHEEERANTPLLHLAGLDTGSDLLEAHGPPVRLADFGVSRVEQHLLRACRIAGVLLLGR
eukprot:scaffold1520_cov240-Pinguiococcus_pyrenoidosus.AAC.1